MYELILSRISNSRSRRLSNALAATFALFYLMVSPAYSAEIKSEFTSITLDNRAVNLHYFHGLPENPGNPSLKVILLHGIPSGNSMFLPLMAELASLGNVETFAVSFPGFGRSDAPSTLEFDYSEDILNDVPFLFADAVGVDEFLPVSHDFGGAWLYCEAVDDQEKFDRLQGLVVMNAPISTPEEPFFSREVVNEFALLTGDPLVPRLEVAEEQADLLQRGTAGDVFQEWPLIVREIAITNTQPAHREAFEALMAIGLADPRGFGGECAGELAPFDLLNPLLVWALPDHLDHLLYYQEIWPSSTLVLLGNQSGLSHFTPFDFEQEIAAAIAQYAQSIFP